jgi:hypothetical protein
MLQSEVIQPLETTRNKIKDCPSSEILRQEAA